MSTPEPAPAATAAPPSTRTARYADCHHTVLVSLFGDYGAGKHSLLRRFSSGDLPIHDYRGIMQRLDYTCTRVQLSSHTVKLQVWREERMRDAQPSALIRAQLYRSRHGFVFAYNAASERSFEGARQWLDSDRRAVQRGQPALPRLLVACQTDRADRVVDGARGAALAAEFAVEYAETSAETGDGVSEAMLWIAEAANRRWMATSTSEPPVALAQTAAAALPPLRRRVCF